jgi:hypothetical protein
MKKEPGQSYPQILTRSGPRPIVPAGRPLGPRSLQAPPRRSHDDLRINLLCGRHGRLLLGDRRVGLTPRGHLNHLGQGVKYPLGLPPLFGPGL